MTTTTSHTANPTHRVKPGDTLSSIAGAHGVTLDALLRSNPQIQNPDVIHPGDAVRVPASAQAQAAGRARAAQADAAAAASLHTQAPSGAAPTLERVRRGEAELVRGARGATVANVQRMLTRGGFGVEATGVLGPTTEETIKRFQRAHGIEETGRIGKTTLAALERPALPGSAALASIAGDARTQMSRLLDHAMRSHIGASVGRCYEKVADYIDAVGFGKLGGSNGPTVLQAMPGHVAYARNFAEFMNSGDNAARFGLKRLPIDNPYDAPAGAIVVVAAGSPGTRHPTAGDIAIARGNGLFVNDGPSMGYGDRRSFRANGGRVLGVYVPA